MVPLNPIKTYETLKERYILFFLTTIAQQNNELREELKNYIETNKIIFVDLYVNKSPKYISLNEETYDDLNIEENFKKYLKNTLIPNPYVHQVKAWKTILRENNCIVSTGTGSGKSETFIIPIINHCILNKETKGVKSIIIYPLKSLASDQGDRIGKILDYINEENNYNLTYGILDGDHKTRKENKFYRSEIAGKEEILSEKPDILITNYVMLERLLIDPKNLQIFDEGNIKFIVLDEIHYYSGAQGIDVSLLMRRLQYFLNFTNNTNIQYIGTSATLGSPHSKEVNKFLKNLFNINFGQEQIVVPQYDDEFKNDPFYQPHKIAIEEYTKLNLNEESYRFHSFFSSPLSMYRCQDCNFLTHIESEQCPNCNSSEIYEMVTCRHCGEEYFAFEYEKPDKKCKTQNIEFLELKKKDDNTEESEYLILSKKEFTDNSRKLYYSITEKKLVCDREDLDEENNENIKEYYLIYDEKIDLKNSNDSFCPKCQASSRAPVIVSTSRLSDENCSHVIFNELFQEIPKDRQKLLIFTDNVQRSSKFAREIEETHLKNIARTFMLRELKENSDSVKISKFLISLASEIEEEFEEFEMTNNKNIIEKEIYEEIFSKGTSKVASLKKRNLFDIKIEKTIDHEFFEYLIEILFSSIQTRKYYELKTEIGGFNSFLSLEEIEKKIYKKVNNINQLRGEIPFDFKKKLRELLDLCIKERILISFENLCLLSDKNIKIFRNDNFNSVELNENYYDSWISKNELTLINAKIDTGKLSAEDRKQYEDEFKSSSNSTNMLVATPTLELGIDIGELDFVGLLYAPPSPAQYVQRAGRSGRKGTSSFILTYLSKRTLDMMYYSNPEILIKGEIIPPNFIIDLELPLSKSLFSLTIFYLLNKTSFKNEIPQWSNYWEWINKFPKIKEYISNHKENINDYLVKYLEFIEVEFNLDNYINLMLEKIDEFINIEKRLMNNKVNLNNNRYSDIFNFLQNAGVLPDYAFGTGGVRLLQDTNNYIIDGYNLTEICPPSTLDHNKIKFKSIGIGTGNKNIQEFSKEVSRNYKVCERCDNLIYINSNCDSCTVCFSKTKLIEKKLIEPKIILIKKTSFNIDDKRIKWEDFLVDCPNELIYDSNNISNPFTGIINKKFMRVIGGSERGEYHICEKCGLSYNDKDSKEKNKCKFGDKHMPLNSEICEQIKTRILLYEVPNNFSMYSTTIINTFISSLLIKSGADDGQVNGFRIKNSNYIVFYDNIEGGVGFVDYLKDNFEDIIQSALKLCEKDCCEYGCIRCIGSYRRQNDLNKLRKREITPYLRDLI